MSYSLDCILSFLFKKPREILLTTDVGFYGEIFWKVLNLTGLIKGEALPISIFFIFLIFSPFIIMSLSFDYLISSL